MPTIGTSIDISALVEATAAGDSSQVISVARELLRRGAPTAELAARIGLIVAHGDSDGHAILTLSAAAALSRWVAALERDGMESGSVSSADVHNGRDQSGPYVEIKSHEQELPLLVQALLAVAPALRAGKTAQYTYPEPLFPSELPQGKTVNEYMHNGIYDNDETLVERLLFGLYGTGADYRTMEVRTYDGISTTFQNAGHPLMFAVRGFQLLDAAEWGERAPHILHWLAPHLPLHSEEPVWVNDVRAFNADPAHSLASLRARISAPKEANALPLRSLILSSAGTTEVCQGVYDALMKGGASSRGVGSVIALAAADVMQMVEDLLPSSAGKGGRDAFVLAAHGLLFSAAVRLVYAHVQDIEALPLLFTSAAYINALQKSLGQSTSTSPGDASVLKSAPQASLRAPTPAGAINRAPTGGGTIAPVLVETLMEQLEAQDVNGAMATARRYLRLGNDARAMFAAIGLVAAQADAAADQGHTLAIVQAAGEEYMAWPASLADTSVEAFLHVALRAAAFAQRNDLVAHL